jgi:hypothetical protein
VLPGGPLGWVAGCWAEGPVGLNDLVAVAVVDDGRGGLAPGPPASGRSRYRPELLAQVAGGLMLGGQAGGAALPGQLANDLAVGGAQVGIGLQPAGPVLLVPAQGQLGLGGPVGLLAGHRHRSWPGPGWSGWTPEAKHHAALALRIVVGGRLQGLAGLGPTGAGPLELPRPVTGSLVEQALKPVTLLA